MAQVAWSARSAADLRSIYELVSRRSPIAGLSLVTRIVAATRRLENFPRSGRIVPELDRSEIREIIVGSYRIVYRLEGEEVGIVTVRHGARLLRAEDVESG